MSPPPSASNPPTTARLVLRDWNLNKLIRSLLVSDAARRPVLLHTTPAGSIPSLAPRTFWYERLDALPFPRPAPRPREGSATRLPPAHRRSPLVLLVRALGRRPPRP